MSCQHKYQQSKSGCKSPPLKDGYCTLHHKQISKQKIIKNDGNNNTIDNKVITNKETLDDKIIQNDQVIILDNKINYLSNSFKLNDNEFKFEKDNKNIIWFEGKEIVTSLGYNNYKDIIDIYIDDKYKKFLGEILRRRDSRLLEKLIRNRKSEIYISENGIIQLLATSKLDNSMIKLFKEKFLEEILPSIRKIGNNISKSSKIASLSNDLYHKQNKIIYFYEINDITPYLNLNVIYFGDTGEVVIINGITFKIYKIGLSHVSIERDFKEHKKTFVAYKMVHIKHCDNNIVVKQYLKMELRAKDLIYELPKKSSNDNNISKYTETFVLTERYDINYMIDLINRLVDNYPLNSIRERDEKIREQNNKLKEKEIDLKIKEEDTKQKGYDVELAKIQLEIIRLKYNLVPPEEPESVARHSLSTDYMDAAIDAADKKLAELTPFPKFGGSVCAEVQTDIVYSSDTMNDATVNAMDDSTNNAKNNIVFDIDNDIKSDNMIDNDNNPCLKNEKIDILTKAIDVDDITPYEQKKEKNVTDKYIIRRYYLKQLLKIELTDDVIKIWYNKIKQLNNLLCAIGKKSYNDSKDPYFINMENKIQYLNKILNIFGFKSPLNFEIVITSNDDLLKEFENSKIIEKNNYITMMEAFGKRILSYSDKYDLKKFLKICNSILNEFCVNIDQKKIIKTTDKQKIYCYEYKLKEHFQYLKLIIEKNV